MSAISWCRENLQETHGFFTIFLPSNIEHVNFPIIQFCEDGKIDVSYIWWERIIKNRKNPWEMVVVVQFPSQFGWWTIGVVAETV